MVYVAITRSKINVYSIHYPGRWPLSFECSTPLELVIVFSLLAGRLCHYNINKMHSERAKRSTRCDQSHKCYKVQHTSIMVAFPEILEASWYPKY